MLHQILFILFALICVAGAVNMVLQRHPINSALSLIVVMGSLGLIYLLLGAPLIAAVQIIVYAGAIMVLFVFVIMLLNAGEEERDQKAGRQAILLGVPGVALMVLLLSLAVFRSESNHIVQLGGFTAKQELPAATREARTATAEAQQQPNEPATATPAANESESGKARNPLEVSMLLFTKYVLAFEVTGILLLIAIMGAVVLARREEGAR